MFWRNLPSWLRGGIIASFVWLVLYLLILTRIAFFVAIFFIIITGWTGLYGNCSLEGCSALYSAIPIISLIEFFVIGAVIFLISEKMSKK